MADSSVNSRKKFNFLKVSEEYRYRVEVAANARLIELSVFSGSRLGSQPFKVSLPSFDDDRNSCPCADIPLIPSAHVEHRSHIQRSAVDSRELRSELSSGPGELTTFPFPVCRVRVLMSRTSETYPPFSVFRIPVGSRYKLCKCLPSSALAQSSAKVELLTASTPPC